MEQYVKGFKGFTPVKMCGLSPLASFYRNTPRGVLGLMFAGYVPLTSQSPYPIIVYFLANRRPHLSHLLENVILAIPT